VLILKEKNNNIALVLLLSNCPQVLHLVYDSPVNCYCWLWWCMFTRL